jgi:putative protease
VKRSDIEIMAPVGSYESLAAAIQGGADSVYFGVEQLNMRAKSSINFTINDLKEIVRIANENNLKTYLTINTVVYNHELAVMRQIVDAAKENGVTAIIAADQAVIMYARKKGVEVHISTQVNISNTEAIEFYAPYADVMVLARELSLKQMEEIVRSIETNNIRGPKGELIKIEIFAHGALCMAVSGKCYLSLHHHNASANRGACLQNCRRSYEVTEKETGYKLEIDNEYIMSPKDLCTIGFLDRIVKTGVKVLKIEGRARPAEYVKTVCECYNTALIAIENGTYTTELIEELEVKLKTVFNRGFWDGYYLGKKLGEWTSEYGSIATKRKVYVGKVTNYFQKIGVGEFLLEAGSIKLGDELLIVGPSTGVVEMKAEEIRFDLKNVEVAEKGQIISMPQTAFLRRSDKLYKMEDR